MNVPCSPRTLLFLKSSHWRLLFSLAHPSQNQQVGRHHFYSHCRFRPSLLPPAVSEDHPLCHTLSLPPFGCYLLISWSRSLPFIPWDAGSVTNLLGTFRGGDHRPSLSSSTASPPAHTSSPVSAGAQPDPCHGQELHRLASGNVLSGFFFSDQPSLPLPSRSLTLSIDPEQQSFFNLTIFALTLPFLASLSLSCVSLENPTLS